MTLDHAAEQLSTHALLMFLLARDYARHAQPLEPLWQEGFGPEMRRIAQEMATPESAALDDLLTRTEERTLQLLRNAQTLGEAMRRPPSAE
jgi:hypothetical protein